MDQFVGRANRATGRTVGQALVVRRPALAIGAGRGHAGGRGRALANPPPPVCVQVA